MPIARVMVIGDSLVRGDDAVVGSHRAFRGRLQELLTAGGYLTDFVGSQSLEPAVGGVDPNHEGYALAKIDSGTDNIAGKVSTILASGVGVDVIVLLVGWEDVIANTASIGTAYTTLVDSITAAKPSAKVFICTLPAYYGKTESETGVTYPAYGTLNAAIRAKTGANITLVDLASLAAGGSAGERTAFVERVISESKKSSDTLRCGPNGEKAPPDPYGGAVYLDMQGIRDLATLSDGTTLYSGDPGMIPGQTYAEQWRGLGRDHWIANVSQAQIWTHFFLAPGHTATNAGGELRNLCAMILTTDGRWVELFSGARVAGYYWDGDRFYDNNAPWTLPPGCVFRQQPDGISSFFKPAYTYGTEAWQIPRQSDGFGWTTDGYHGVNREALANMAALMVVAQVRIALDDPNGPNDIAQARLTFRCGADLQTVNGSGLRVGPDGQYAPYRKDWLGYPYTQNSMNGGRYAFVEPTTEWQTVGFVTMQGQPFVPGLGPPWHLNYPPSVYGQAPYGRTEAQIRANPPPLPSYWTYTLPATGFPTTDYAGTTYLLAQSGADRIAQEIFARMVASGVMAGYTDTGGPAPLLAPGASTSPRYAAQRVQPADTLYAYVAAEASAAPTGPVWATTGLPTAVRGTTYSSQLYAGTGATFTHVSGKPSWLTVASDGTLGGSVGTGADETYAITFRATLDSISVDRTLVFNVSNLPVITTTTLPAAIIDEPYSALIAYTGAEPITIGMTGTLPAGLTRTGAVISGTPTALGTSGSLGFSASNSLGTSSTVNMTISVIAAGSPPSFTTTSLPAGTVGDAYSQTVTITGASSTSLVGALPGGLTYNATTRVISGTLTAAESKSFTIVAVGTYGTTSRQFTLTVNPVATAALVGGWSRFLRN